MAGRIPQSFIDDLLSRVDILDVITPRVPLRKAGKEYTACCPFHDEKTPSFTVSPSKQFYHCFGCGAHGNALSFLMEYEHAGFVEAIEDLAAQAGVEVPREAQEQPGQHVSHQGLYELLEQAARFFQQQLRKHPKAGSAIDYLKGRGLSGEIAKEFELGYAPPGWDGLIQAFTGQVSPQQLVDAGLVIKKDDGGSYDRFRDRIMFPIRDQRGRVIGFGGRVLGDDSPKYLNSPETPVFHKGRELYGFYQVRKSVRKLEQILVVEGYMDVLALAQFGIRNGVATLGTATTQDHLDRLFRAVNEVVFCFDGDRAGREAATRAMENALPAMREGRQLRFMFLPEGEDPDSLVRKEGLQGFERRIDEGMSFSEFFYEELVKQVDIATMDGRAKLVELARPLLSRLPSGVLHHLMMARLAELARMDQHALTRLLGGAPQPVRSNPVAKSNPSAVMAGKGRKLSLVRRAIALLLNKPALALIVEQPERLAQLQQPGAGLFCQLLTLFADNPRLSAGAVVEHWRGQDAWGHLVKLLELPLNIPEQGIEGEFLGVLQRMEAMLREQRLDELCYKERQQALTDQEKQELNQLLRELKH